MSKFLRVAPYFTMTARCPYCGYLFKIGPYDRERLKDGPRTCSSCEKRYVIDAGGGKGVPGTGEPP